MHNLDRKEIIMEPFICHRAPTASEIEACPTASHEPWFEINFAAEIT